jgi:hypothetical protein
MSTADHASSSSLLQGKNLLKLWTTESGNVGEPTTDPLIIADPPKDNERKSEHPWPEPPLTPPSNNPLPDPPSPKDSSTPSRNDIPKSDLAGESGGLPKKLKACKLPVLLFPKLWLLWYTLGTDWDSPSEDGSESFIPAEKVLKRRIVCRAEDWLCDDKGDDEE